MGDYQPREQGLTFSHSEFDIEGTPTAMRIEHLTGDDARKLRAWFERVLRVEDCRAAHAMLLVLNSCVHQQAYEQGKADALNHQEDRSHPSATILWNTGYHQGFNAFLIGKKRETVRDSDPLQTDARD